MISTRTLMVLALLLLELVMLTPSACPGENIDHFSLQAVTVTGVASEYVLGVNDAGVTERFLTGSGRFYDSLGQLVRPGGAIARGDVLYVVCRASDRERTVLTGVLRPRDGEAGQPAYRSQPATGDVLVLEHGLSVTLARGWKRGAGDIRYNAYYDSGLFSRIFFEVVPATAPSTESILKILQLWGIPDPLLCVRDLVTVNGSMFEHEQGVHLEQQDVGRWRYYYHNRQLQRMPAPVHRLTFRDIYRFRTTDGKSAVAVSYVPVSDYSSRIKDVWSMVSSLRLRLPE